MVKVLMAKSASGKDYIQKILVKEYKFIPIVSTTSRPQRINEVDGIDYNFVSKDEFLQLINSKELIEYRTYHTLVNGVADIWYYGLTKQEFDKDKNYVVILDVKGTKDFIEYIGRDNVEVYYIDCSDEVRTNRAKLRGSYDETEWQRRLLDDAIVFDSSNMRGISPYIVYNQDGKVNDAIEKIVREKI